MNQGLSGIAAAGLAVSGGGDVTRYVYDCVLRLQLGPAEREFDARITYQGGPLQADIERIEVRRGGVWIAVPQLEDLLEECAVLFDTLRAHAAGRREGARSVALALRRGG